MTILQVGNIFFNSIIIIIASGISSHILHGYGTKRWKETFVGILLFVLVAVQVITFIHSSNILIKNYFKDIFCD
jgi:hypothetical protein